MGGLTALLLLRTKPLRGILISLPLLYIGHKSRYVSNHSKIAT